MMNWATLATEADTEVAASRFESICNELNIDRDITTRVCAELPGIPSAYVYANLVNPPSLSGLQTFLSNIEGWIDEALYSSFETAVKSASELTDQRSIISIDVNLELNTINSFTYDIAVMTLINIMAGCSKIGLGTHDDIGMISGAPELAEALFQDPGFVARVKMLRIIARKHAQKNELMVPFMFASGVLLAGSSNKQGLTFLSSSVKEYEEIQKEEPFGNCLTEAALKANAAYHNFFYADNQDSENNVLDNFSQVMPEVINKLIMQVRENIKSAIQNRIMEGDDIHLNLAKSWMNGPMNLSPRSPSVRLNTPVSLRSLSMDTVRTITPNPSENSLTDSSSSSSPSPSPSPSPIRTNNALNKNSIFSPSITTKISAFSAVKPKGGVDKDNNNNNPLVSGAGI